MKPAQYREEKREGRMQENLDEQNVNYLHAADIHKI